jgi:two-component system CheB/CheR fusion protein
MPYRTLDDRIDGLVITFTDITASKAEETLLKENRYRRLFESAKDGILILNAETGNIIDVNPF